jgi:XapX domain-containing protein
MILAALGISLAFGIGVACRMLDIPVPAPPRIQGALLVVAMTTGFVLGDWLLR